MRIDDLTWQWLAEYRSACSAELKLQQVTEMEIERLSGGNTRLYFPQLQPRHGMLPIFDRDDAGRLSITFNWRTLKRE